MFWAAFFCFFVYFVPLVTEIVISASKSLFWPANGVRSTCLLVKIHNKWFQVEQFKIEEKVKSFRFLKDCLQYSTVSISNITKVLLQLVAQKYFPIKFLKDYFASHKQDANFAITWKPFNIDSAISLLKILWIREKGSPILYNFCKLSKWVVFLFVYFTLDTIHKFSGPFIPSS